MNQPLPTDGQAMRNYVENYSYDAVGNFLQMVHQAANGNWTRTYAYDEPNASPTNNRLTSTMVGSLKEPYTYDADGNMTQMPHLPQMAWDFKDQLASTQQQVVSNVPGETTYYVYDATGGRVRKVTQAGSGARTIERIYLGGYEVYREYASDGSSVTLERQTLHVMDDKRRVAMAETNTTSGAATILRYQFDNHLGSSSLELDASGAIISYEEYYPYGSTSYQAVPGVVQVSLKRYRYTGKERDEETGFYYHGARYYAAWLGRWTRTDPASIDPAASSLYEYCQNRPVVLADPDGKDPGLAPTGSPVPQPPPGLWGNISESASKAWDWTVAEAEQLPGQIEDAVESAVRPEALQEDIAQGEQMMAGEGVPPDPVDRGGGIGMGAVVVIGAGVVLIGVTAYEALKSPDPPKAAAAPQNGPVHAPGASDPNNKAHLPGQDTGTGARIDPAPPVGPKIAPPSTPDQGPVAAPGAQKPNGTTQTAPTKQRTPEENKKARNKFKNNKDAAREAWEKKTGRTWPTDENGNPWPAEHTPPLKEGGDPMDVYPRDPSTDPHMVPGPDGLNDYQRWGALGTPAREQKKEQEKQDPKPAETPQKK
jgi:RHS repeat-associated protein